MFPLNEKLKKHLKGFIFPKVPVEDWMLANKINCLPLSCSKCNNELLPLIPIASKLDRGVCYDPCPCGDLPPVTLVSACPKERQSDIEFFKLLANQLKD